MAGELLQTKLQIPPGRPDLVPRPGLIHRLEQGLRLGQRLTLVSAPAGFGKTTLVAEWLRQASRPITWLSLDVGENDPARFLAYLISALQQVQPGVGETVISLSRSPQPPEAESLLTMLINDIASSMAPFIMAIDDYQVINNPAVHTQLIFLLENQPTQMHQVIMTREDPPMPLARWRARGQVNEVRPGDLRFNNEEISHLLKGVLGLDLVPDDIAALERRTEGWIAGLQLAALSMRGQADLPGFVRAFAGSSRYILDYLVEEVFNRQTAGVQAFLLQTSILDRLSAPLCDAVTGRDDSQVMLSYLERANLFLTPDGQSHSWYRFHRLFAEFLRHRLRITGKPPETVLHRRAGRWLEANDFIEEALYHMLAAGEWAEAERLTVLAAVVAIRHGQLLTVQRWLDAFPNDVVSSSHDLATLKAFGLLLAGQLEAAATYVDLAFKLLPSDAPSFSLGFVILLRSYLALAQGEAPQALALAREALAYLEEADPYFLRGAVLNSLAQALTQGGDLAGAAGAYQQIVTLSHQGGQPLFAVGAKSSLAWILHLQGKRIEAANLCREVIDLCTTPQREPLPVSGLAHIILGILHGEANELDEALSHLLKARAYGEQMGLASGIPHASRIALVSWQLAAGQREAALATLEEARIIAGQYKSAYVTFAVAGAEAELRFRQGELETAEHILEQSGLSPAGIPTHASESHYITYARLLLAQRRFNEAETLLANLEKFAKAGGRQRALIAIYILQALARQARGQEDLALSRLEMALRLAAPEGYRRAFLDEGAFLLTLLPKVQHGAPHFVKQLLADAQTEPDLETADRPAQPLLDPLSDRELEVLALIANGLSNQEIADRLFIGLGTVKTHAHNIYGKLDAGGRTQAVARARELNIL